MNRCTAPVLGILVALALATGTAAAQVDARMFRQPAVSATHIAFVYAGDIWVVPRQGGLAVRLSSPRGEEQFPRFSPDGSHIAFSGNYDGNTDVYVVPTLGGEPVRLTSHPMDDRVVGWHPDGRRVLFVSSRESGRQRYNQFYLVPVTGGLPEKLPVPYGEFGAFSPDGRQFAYMPQSQDFRNWKRYRGGWAPDIWLFDLTTFESKNITRNPAIDAQPMWHGPTIYFMSDRDAAQRQNIWAYDTKTGATRQVTHFTDFDITFPSIGPDAIVFQAGGRLYLLDLATEKAAEVRVQVTTDLATLKPRLAQAEPLADSYSVSPTGKRVAVGARGDVFSLPAEHGPVENLTRSSGVAERYPRWSPDGRLVAYFTDRTGEYQLAIRPADGSGAEQILTSFGPGFRYAPHWSPDGKRLAFIDQSMRIFVYDVDRKQATAIDRSRAWIAHDGLAAFRFSWSADSRWLAYSRPVETLNPGVFLFDTKGGTLHQITAGYFADTQPTFDPEGRYLYYLSDRAFTPVYGQFDGTWTYANPTQIVALPLRADVASPLAQRNDVEGGKSETGKAEGAQKGGTKPASAASAKGKDKAAAAGGEKEKAESAKESKERPAPVEIDLAGIEGRAVVLPPKADNYDALTAVKGRLVFRRAPRAGSGQEKSAVCYYDLEEREEKTILDDADAIEVTADGKKLLAVKDRKAAVVEVKENQKMDKPLRTGEMLAPVDPRAEWRQIFTDTFRFERDYFYDAGMHGVDWEAVRRKYAPLVEAAVTRWDVDVVIGEFIGELNASHTYHGGGDMEQASKRGVGMLGVDWEVADGAYRIKRIIRGAPWDTDARSPLADPGLGVKDGDYVLAVDGVPLETSRDPWAAFQGLADQPVTLTVNAEPKADGARQVVVRCLGDETELRFRDWIEQRRKRVDEATGGKAGYIYVQSTGVDAQNELMRQFMAQWTKPGLIVDERFNSGGQIPDRFIELLNRPLLSYWAGRDGDVQRSPVVAHAGPKVMLINGWSGSGGDAFPFYFREAKLGPIVGTRTWGGLIGISGAPGLVDGGSVTVPTFRMFDVRGRWFAEGHGVDPDILVEEDPASLAKGIDTQLERGIEELKARIAAQPAAPARPAPEKRVPEK